MWSSWPALRNQPTADFVPDQPSRVLIPGYGQYFWDRFAYGTNFAAGTGGDITLTAVEPNIHAIHALINVGINSDFYVRLGDRYSIRLYSETYDETTQGFNGRSQLAGSQINPYGVYRKVSYTYLNAALMDRSSVITTANLSSGFSWPYSQLALCVGYAYAADKSLKMYAHLIPNGGNTCGSGTCSLLTSVNAADAFSGKASFLIKEPTNGDGDISFRSISCHIGPFLESQPRGPETATTRATHRGDRVASLRSRSVNFTQPIMSSQVLPIDCGGHSEFLPTAYGYLPNELFSVALNGQPDADTAWVAPSSSYRSTCGFSPSQNVKLSKLKVEVTNINFGFYSSDQSFTIDSVTPTRFGDNEYEGSVSKEIDLQSFLGITTSIIRCWVSISGSEAITNENTPATLGDAVMATSFYVRSLFYAPLNEREEVLVAGQSRSLSESEAADFFNGSPLSLNVYPLYVRASVVVTAIGTA